MMSSLTLSSVKLGTVLHSGEHPQFGVCGVGVGVDAYVHEWTVPNGGVVCSGGWTRKPPLFSLQPATQRL